MKTPEDAVRIATTAHLGYDHGFHIIGTHRLTHEALVAYHYLGSKPGRAEKRPTIGFSTAEPKGDMWQYQGGGECSIPQELNRKALCLFGRNGSSRDPFTAVVGRVYGPEVATVEFVLANGQIHRAEPRDGFFFLAVERTGVDCEVRVLDRDGRMLERTADQYFPIVASGSI